MILYQALNHDVTNHNTLRCLLWSAGYRAVLYMVGNQLSNTTTQEKRKGKTSRASPMRLMLPLAAAVTLPHVEASDHAWDPTTPSESTTT
jgi:hypothetical protein